VEIAVQMFVVTLIQMSCCGVVDTIFGKKYQRGGKQPASKTNKASLFGNSGLLGLIIGVVC